MSVATADASVQPSAKLALIYSRLKALEIEKDQPHPLLSINKKIGKSKIEQRETNDICTIFRDATSSIRNKLQAEFGDNLSSICQHSIAAEDYCNQEITDSLRVLLLAEEHYAQSLVSSLEEKIKYWRALRTERDQNINQMFQKRQGLVTLEEKIKELEDICRNLQKLAKEKDDYRSQLVLQEKMKTDQLQSECLQSIAAVTTKIEEEEEELKQKAQENEELQSKLEQFTYHMRLRKEKVRNEERARELQAKLEEAKRAQFDYFQEQEKLKAQSLKSRVHHLEETVHSLRSQLSNYGGKFEEFEDTLKRSAAVLDKVDEREATLNEILSNMKCESLTLKQKATEADVSIIQALEQKRVEENEFIKVKATYEKFEKKCRKLMLQRQQVMKNRQIASESGNKVPVESAKRLELVGEIPSAPRYASPVMTSSSMATETKSSSTPSRRIHNFVMSSSSSPSRPSTAAFTGLVGEGSPIHSPSIESRKHAIG
jgi:hypothetical protein